MFRLVRRVALDQTRNQSAVKSSMRYLCETTLCQSLCTLSINNVRFIESAHLHSWGKCASKLANHSLLIERIYYIFMLAFQDLAVNLLHYM